MALRNLNSPAVSSRHRFLSFAFVNDALNFGGTFARAKAEKAASSDTAGEFDRKCSTGSVSDLSLPIYRHFEARGRSRSPYCTNSPAVSSRHRFLSFAFVNDALNFGGTFARAKAGKAASSDTAGEFDRKCSTAS